MYDDYFVKFPKTHWLPVSKKQHKSERYLSKTEVEELFSGKVNISEKLDGANIGLSFKNGELILQKRGGIIGTGEHPQYGAFKDWAYQRYNVFSRLPQDLIIFGEWMFAKHSIHYTCLPDYFFMFDVWQDGEFLPIEERDSLASMLGIYTPPVIYEGILSVHDVPKLVAQSAYSEERMEGIVARNSNIRGKYVRDDFIAGNVHWTKQSFTRNILKT